MRIPIAVQFSQVSFSGFSRISFRQFHIVPTHIPDDIYEPIESSLSGATKGGAGRKAAGRVQLGSGVGIGSDRRERVDRARGGNLKI